MVDSNMSNCQKCLICHSLAKSSNGKPENGNTINCEITAFFLTKKLFQLSNLTFTNLLMDHGNPSSWFVCCSKCFTAVRNLQVVFNQLMKIEYKWKTLKSNLELRLFNSYTQQKNKAASDSDTSEAIIQEEICKRLENEFNSKDIKIEFKDENKQYEDQPKDSMLPHMDEDIFSDISNRNDEGNFEESENTRKSTPKKTKVKRLKNAGRKKSPSRPRPTNRGASSTKKLKNASKDDLISNLLRKDDTGEDVRLNSNTQNVNSTTDSNISLTKIIRKRTGKISRSKKLLTPNKQLIQKKPTNYDHIKPVDGVYTCSLCGKGFKIRTSFIAHRKVHFPNDPEEKSPPKFKYFIEVDKSLPEKENTKSDFRCRSCEKTFDSAIRQYEHENAAHGLKNQFVCMECKNCFNTAHGVFVHFNGIHGCKEKIYNQNPQKNYICEHCGKFFSCPNTLKTHVEAVHKNIRNFVCETCSRSFTQLRYLKCHQIREHNMNFDDIHINELRCEQCGKIMRSSNALRLHIKGVHEKKYRFYCSVCNVGRFSQSAMNVHMRTHDNEKSQKCSRCTKSFVSKPALVEHMRRHNNETPFSCKHCDRSFFSKHSLQRHEELHDGQIYKCEFCDKTFLTKHYIRNHRRYAHKVQLRKSAAKEPQKSIGSNH